MRIVTFSLAEVDLLALLSFLSLSFLFLSTLRLFSYRRQLLIIIMALQSTTHFARWRTDLSEASWLAGAAFSVLFTAASYSYIDKSQVNYSLIKPYDESISIHIELADFYAGFG